MPPAKGDWIDAFPSATAVARAAFEELKVTSARGTIDRTRDDDAIAINLAGMYVTLREIIFLKRRAETLMSPARRDKLDRLVASYQEAGLIRTVTTVESGSWKCCAIRSERHRWHRARTIWRRRARGSCRAKRCGRDERSANPAAPSAW